MKTGRAKVLPDPYCNRFGRLCQSPTARSRGSRGSHNSA